MLVINVTDGGIRMAELRLGDADFAYVLSIPKILSQQNVISNY